MAVSRLSEEGQRKHDHSFMACPYLRSFIPILSLMLMFRAFLPHKESRNKQLRSDTFRNSSNCLCFFLSGRSVIMKRGSYVNNFKPMWVIVSYLINKSPQSSGLAISTKSSFLAIRILYMVRTKYLNKVIRAFSRMYSRINIALG